MSRYEFSEDGSNKFWEITLRGTEVLTHYGKIGSAGQSTTKSFGSVDEAKKAHDKLVAEKTKKGYVAKGAAAATPAGVSKVASAETHSLIQRLDTWMKANRADYYKNLKPGASAEDVAKFEEKLGAKLPPTLTELLIWKGDDDDCDGRFLDNWSLMGLEDIVDAWTCLNELQENGEFDDNGKNWWNKAWVPFLANGGGDHLCVDVTGAVKKKGAVLIFWHDEDDRDVEYASVDKLFTKFVTSLEKGNWALDDDGFFSFGPDVTPE